jgi:hypothetical protein
MRKALMDKIERLLSAWEADRSRGDELLTEGYAEAMRIDAERLALERTITMLAGRADDPATAKELRTAWLRHSTLATELRDLRAVLRRLRAGLAV